MSRDLLQSEFVFTADEKITVMGKLDILHGESPHCAVCDAGVDVAFLRKHHDTPVHKAVCLPCFLDNFTNTSLSDINRMIEIAKSQKWYK